MCNSSSIQTDTNTTTTDYNNITRSSFRGFSENILSKDDSERISFALECVIFPVLTVFGITGNILSLFVLSKKITTTSILLISLAVADALFLLCNMLQKSTCIIQQFDDALSIQYFVYSFSPLFYIKTSISRVSTWLVVVISSERLFAVVFPLTVKCIVTKTKTTAAVVAVYGFTFVTLILLPFQYDIKTINGTPVLALNHFHNDNEEFFNVYNRYFLNILFRWVPKTFVIILNTSICWVLNKKIKNVATIPFKDSRQHRDQKRITKMLLVVAMVFVICLLPGDAFLIANIANQEFKIYGKYHYLFITLSDVAILFEMINSSANFVIYIAVNSSFSTLYRSLLCPRQQRGDGLGSFLSSPNSFSFRRSSPTFSNQSMDGINVVNSCGPSVSMQSVNTITM